MPRPILALLVLSLALSGCREDKEVAMHEPPRDRSFAKTSPHALETFGNVTVLAKEGKTAEGAIAISPADPRIVIAAGIHESTRVDVFLSRDGGHTWRDAQPLPLTIPGRVLTGHFDPVLAFDRNGVAYLGVVGVISVSNTTTVLYRSTDGGASWVALDVSKTQQGRIDKPWLAVDATTGALHMLWAEFATGGPFVITARSTDGGATWTQTLKTKTNGWPYVAHGAGSLYMTHIPVSEQNYTVTRSTDGGATWTPESVVAPHREPGNIAPPLGATGAHQIASGLAAGSLYCVYTNRPAASFFTRSLDGGLTWSTPMPLSAPESDSAFPGLTVDPLSGDVVLAWTDRRDDPSRRTARLYTTTSTDGGASFPDPIPASPAFGVTNGFLGHYNQIAAHGTVRLATFTDEAGRLSVARLTDSPPPEPPRRRRAVRH